MKKVIILVIVFFLVPYLYGNTKFIPDFGGNHQYIKIFQGSESYISKGDRGEIFDKYNKLLGNFEVIGINDSYSIVRAHLEEPDKIIKVEHLSFTSVKDILELSGKNEYKNIRFSLEDSKLYFRIKRTKTNVKIKDGIKGKIFKNEQVAGIFKIIGSDRYFCYGFVTNNAANINFRESDEGKFLNYFDQIMDSTGFVNLSYKNIIMLLIGIFFIYLGISKDYEPLLLVPIGFGIIVGNIPLPLQLFNSISIYMIDPISHQYVFNTTSNSVMGIIYFGVRSGLFPPLIFLGIGAMTDFTALLSNPKSVLLGAAAQVGIFITFLAALKLGFSPANAASIGIIGGADGPTAIFLSSKLAPSLIGPIAIAAYSYMAMVPLIQPPIMKLLTSKKERLIRMKHSRKVKKIEKIMFPVFGVILTTMVAPGAIPLLGMLFLGNLLKESGVTTRLAKTASNALIDIATILLGFAVGTSTSAQVFLNKKSVLIFVLGVVSFSIATASGVLFAKLMNLFVKNKVNPLIGAAGVSAVPDSARVVHNVGKKYDPNNYLLMHAMGPNVAGVIGSAIAAGVFLGIF
jgi:oxaloacetate decarboxylase beta subunit